MRAARPPTPEVTAVSGVRGRIRHTRGTVVVIALALALVVSGSPLAANAAKPTSHPGGGTTGEPAIPKGMAAAGDSISIATNHSLTCTIFGGCTSRSWTTGSNTTVDSHFLRLRDYNSRLTTRNAAFSGAKMESLDGQFTRILANNYRPGYVTVLIGANDICGPRLTESLTETADFKTQFQTAMNNLYLLSPNTSVFVASIPDLERLYGLMRPNNTAVNTWAQYGVCPHMLTAGIDRTPAQLRQGELNAVLKEVCESFVTATPTLPNRCRYDGGAVFNTDFVAADVSTVDYFHPSAAGQNKLSRIAWEKSFWPTR